MWSSNGFAPRVSDERAYLLQAEIFANGKWSLPARPMPEFFEQEHIFVTPFVAGKYPPGHSILLVPGIWIHWPPLVPLILASFAGGLMFVLCRELSNGSVALLAWSLWITMTPNLGALASYFSETTTLVLWLLGWLALLKRHRDGSGRWVIVAMVCAAWMMITRPLTGIAYGIPTGLTLLHIEYQRREWRPLLMGALLVAVVAAIVPVWSMQTLGSWTPTPYQQWSRVYTPYDKLGFGLDSSPPLRAFPPDLANDYARFRELHRNHTADPLPSVLRDRIFWIVEGVWPNRRLILLLPFVIGLASLSLETLLGPIGVLALIGAYLVFPHPRYMLLYYAEIFPVLAFVAAIGIQRIIDVLSRKIAKRPSIVSPITATVAFLVLLASPRLVKSFREQESWKPDPIRELIAAIPTPRNIVFVRYPMATESPFLTVANGPFLERERNVVVFDRGPAENKQLAALFPNRKTYLLTVEDYGKARLTDYADQLPRLK
ncbi:MAG: hypothetical protein ABI556_05725 [Gemmatimonadales bacterium]